MSRVPIAVDRHGARRIAISSTKCDEPFHCGECGAACVLRKGMQRVHHFAHRAATEGAGATGCTGGGEGAIHEACKLFIKENIGSIVFAKACSECGEEIARWKGTEAVVEKDVLANGERYRVDLLANNETDGTKAVVEVLHTHRCSGDKLADLASAFGDRVFEVESFDYEEVTLDLPLVLSCVNRSRCASCVARAEEKEAQRRLASERALEQQLRLQEEQQRRLQEDQQRRLQEEQQRRLQEEQQRRCIEAKARETHRLQQEQQRQCVEAKAREAQRLQEEREERIKQHWQHKREEAEQEVRENKLWAANKLYEALTKACKSRLLATLDKWTNETESGCKRSDPVFRAWLQEGMPIKCTSSGAYLSSMPNVYKCIMINPRRWALCDVSGTEFAPILNQALRDERDKRIAFPTFITAERIRKYLKDLCAQERKPLARRTSEDAPKRAVVKRKRSL